MTEHWPDIYYRSYWFILAGWNIEYRDKYRCSSSDWWDFYSVN